MKHLDKISQSLRGLVLVSIAAVLLRFNNNLYVSTIAYALLFLALLST